MADQLRQRHSSDGTPAFDAQRLSGARRALDVAISLAREEQPPDALGARVVRRIESLACVSRDLPPVARAALWPRVYTGKK